jgi:hypothetical protein
LLPQTLKKVSIIHQFRQSPFQLRYDIVLIRQTCFETDIRMYDIPRAPKIRHDRDGTHRQSLKNNPSSKVAKRRKQHDVCGLQPI